MSRQDYVKFFEEADADRSGTLNLDELVGHLMKQGYKGSRADIKRMFQQADTSGDDVITMDEFLVAMGQQEPEVHGKASMRRVFLSFDKDGNGFIDKKELGQIYEEMGTRLTKAQLDRAMSLADTDGSGQLEYEEFIELVFGVKV